MKKFTLSFSFVLFAFALQAGDVKSGKATAAATTTKTSATAKAESSDAKKDCGGCGSCCGSETKSLTKNQSGAKRQALLSPKQVAEKRT